MHEHLGTAPTSPVSTTTLGVAPDAPWMARRWVAITLASWEWTGNIDDTTLMVNELVTNAMIHAAGPIRVTMSLQSSGLWVDVHDTGVGHVTKRQIDRTATVGRGLQVVDLLSRSWGVLTEPDGKHVWFEMTDPTLAGEPEVALA